jgi:hypothetical protein
MASQWLKVVGDESAAEPSEPEPLPPPPTEPTEPVASPTAETSEIPVIKSEAPPEELVMPADLADVKTTVDEPPPVDKVEPEPEPTPERKPEPEPSKKSKRH